MRLHTDTQNKSHGRKSGQFRIIIRQMYLVLRFCGYTRFTFFVCMSVWCVLPLAPFVVIVIYYLRIKRERESRYERERGMRAGEMAIKKRMRRCLWQCMYA